MKAGITSIFITLAAALVVTGSEPKPGEAVLEKLDRIIIPTINFEDTTFEEAFDFIRLRSVELDPEEDSSRRGISFIMFRPAKAADAGDADLEAVAPKGDNPDKIELYQAKNVPFLVALAEICRMARLDGYVTSHGIVLCPLGQAPFPNPKSEKGEIWKKLTEPKPEPADGK